MSSKSNNNIFLQIISVARNTFREAVRDRVLYNLVLFVLLIVVAAVILGDLTDGQEARTTVNMGLGAMLFFGVFIAIFVGVGLVSKEIERRTVYSIFSKPITRSTFIVGKYFGLCLTLLINIIGMGIGVTLALIYVKGTHLIIPAWSAIFLIYFELAILTAVAIAFSSFSTPALSAFLTFFVFIIGHFSTALRELGANLGGSFTKFFFDTIYYVLPNLSHFSFITDASHGFNPNPAYIGSAILYAAVYITVLLIISSIIFGRRNFK
jgi:ABC-type transport system involved in multi-copper enzyme maturation permease subunit